MDNDGYKAPKGFSFAALAAGIKKSGKLDLAMIHSEVPACCAGVFTTNKVVAAPVILTRSRLRGGACQTVLVNSGNANACTGEVGLEDAGACSRRLAAANAVPEELVAVCSTGVIGVPLPMTKFEQGIPALVDALGESSADDVAVAMMTTDSFPKLSARSLEIDGLPVQVLGVAKGAGMIHPDMATMLGFVITDASVDAGFLDQALRRAVAGSFNRITVDRDTSTNDTVLLLANGLAGNETLTAEHDGSEAFQNALQEVLLDLAKMIVRDGEGATKLVRIQVDGAEDDADAGKAAYSVATSSLVKTAFFGEDANWGRIIAAAGYSGAEVDPDRVRILFDEVVMVENGLGLGADQEAKATEVLKKPEFTVTVDLGLGAGSAFYYTSDLTYDYVKINADYRT